MRDSRTNRRWILVTLWAVFLNSLVGRWLQVGPWRPDLLVAALVYLGLTSGPTTAVVMGFLTGLYQDLYAPELLGMHALAKSWTGYLAGIVGEKVQAEQTAIQVTALFLLSLFHETVVGVTLGWAELPGFLWARALLTALYTTAAGLLVVMILSDWLLPRGWGIRDASRRRRVR